MSKNGWEPGCGGAGLCSLSSFPCVLNKHETFNFFFLKKITILWAETWSRTIVTVDSPKKSAMHHHFLLPLQPLICLFPLPRYLEDPVFFFLRGSNLVYSCRTTDFEGGEEKIETDKEMKSCGRFSPSSRCRSCPLNPFLFTCTWIVFGRDSSGAMRAVLCGSTSELVGESCSTSQYRKSGSRSRMHIRQMLGVSSCSFWDGERGMWAYGFLFHLKYVDPALFIRHTNRCERQTRDETGQRMQQKTHCSREKTRHDR